MKFTTTTVLLVAAALGGCTTLQPKEAFPNIAERVEERTGAKITWNQHTDSDREVREAIETLLSRDLTADAAVQVALLNNRSLQATYEDLGIAQAELVQAGLLKNPVFSALLRFPDGGAGNPNLELSVSENFIDLFALPLRKKVAAAKYESAKTRVAAEVISLANDVKQNFYLLQGSEQMLELRRSVADATAASFDAAKRLREAGNTTELDLAIEQATYGQAKLDLAQAESQNVKQREKLISLLGLWGPKSTIRVSHRLPELPVADEGLENIESLAIRQRLDLAGAMSELNATYQSLGVTKQVGFLSDAEITIAGEHDTDGSWIVGPGLSTPVPIFDTGAAQVSIAQSRVRQANQRVYALAVQVRSDARSARADLLAARERANYYRGTVVPLRQKITQQTQLQYNAMIVGVFQLLQAKRDEISAGREYIEALQDYWVARVELERAVGGRLPASAAVPSTMPAVQPVAPTHQHQH